MKEGVNQFQMISWLVVIGAHWGLIVTRRDNAKKEEGGKLEAQRKITNSFGLGSYVGNKGYKMKE